MQVSMVALLDLTMKQFLETLILRSEFSEIIAPFSNAQYGFAESGASGVG
jgi:hypothetical protein